MRPNYYYFASAAVAVDSSHMTASSSASWSRFSSPSNFINWHVSTMWFMVCRWPQSQEGDWARPHLCKLALHGPWPVRKRGSSETMYDEGDQNRWKGWTNSSSSDSSSCGCCCRKLVMFYNKSVFAYSCRERERFSFCRSGLKVAKVKTVKCLYKFVKVTVFTIQQRCRVT